MLIFTRRRGWMMSPTEKEQVCKDINYIIYLIPLFFKNMESLSHIEGALADRKIEIIKGGWHEIIILNDE